MVIHNGVKYTLLGKYLRGPRNFLHRVVWAEANGEIPPGFHVHHIDGNPLNNSIENLSCIDGKAHIASHQKGHGRIPIAAINANKEWRKTEAGKESLRKMGIKNATFLHSPRQLSCSMCGASYEGVKRAEKSFCSNACKSAFRRKNGADLVERKCPVCGGIFKVNKYRPHSSCSRSCGAKNAHLVKLNRG